MKTLNNVFSSHPRRWRDYLYVYPVISRRARGLSLGINLNPDASCSFDCVYCCADRTARRTVRDVDLGVLETELRQLVEARERLYDEPEFRKVPQAFRRLNDVAFSGDGEPTAVKVFPEAARIAAAVRAEYGLADARIVIITNACHLTRPAVAETLAFLDGHNGEIWAKLDSGTEAYFQRVNRAKCSLQHILDNIAARARIRPLVLQSLFVRLHGEPPPPAEVEAYAERVHWVLERGGTIARVQVYTVARRTAEPYVAALDSEGLERIADRVRMLGVPVEVFA